MTQDDDYDAERVRLELDARAMNLLAYLVLGGLLTAAIFLLALAYWKLS